MLVHMISQQCIAVSRSFQWIILLFLFGCNSNHIAT